MNTQSGELEISSILAGVVAPANNFAFRATVKMAEIPTSEQVYFDETGELPPWANATYTVLLQMIGDKK